MNLINILRIKNRGLGAILPGLVAKKNAKLFLTPRQHKLREWEYQAESLGSRIAFGEALSALRWGNSDKRILLMHGWEGRATQMYGLAKPLVEKGFEVIAIDGPMHGQSQGQKSNPVTFSEAILTASKELGPFYGAIGHSMGACALAIAYDMGADLGRYTLISSPARIYDVLRAFASYMGLSVSVSYKFVKLIEEEVGRSSKELDVGLMMKGHDKGSLLIHAKDDLEIPYHSMLRIRDLLQNVKSISPDDLGHRRIMRDDNIMEQVVDFMIEKNESSCL
ncbi:MAG: hypothetical protein ACJAYK_000450 [Crocinitomicaceae bacterium]|jgi:hypothetical protein